MKILQLITIVPAMLAALFFCSCDDSSRDKQLIIATEATFPPYEFREGDKIVGIDPEIMAIVAEKLDRKLVIQDMSFDAVISAVASGKADVGASGITVTEERKREANFTIPYVEANQVILVPVGSKIASTTDLPDKRIGVQHGTTGDIFVTKNIGEPERFQNPALGVSALLAGKIDVMVLDDQPAKVFYKKNAGTLKILPQALTSECYAFVLAKENSALLAQINEILRELKSTGTLDAILEKHLAENPDGNAENPDGNAVPADENSVPADAENAVPASVHHGAFYTNFIEDNRWEYLLKGLGVTLEVAFFAVLLGFIIGTLIAIVRSSHDKTGALPFLNFCCKIYLSVIRGTPVVVQLLIIYFVIFGSVDISKTLVAIVAFGLNSGAYVAEIIRGGIMSIDKGQFEAGRSLGLSFPQTMRLIVLPQVFKNVLPALGNEFIVLLKETSVAGYIALQDLTKAGDIIRSQTYTAFLPLLAVAAIYLCLVMMLEFALARLEKHWKKD